MVLPQFFGRSHTSWTNSWNDSLYKTEWYRFSYTNSFAVGNILIFIVCTMLAKQVARMRFSSNEYSCSNNYCSLHSRAFAINGDVFDIYVTVAFGILGYVLKKNNIPNAPVVLGLMLGGMCENGFNASILLAKNTPIINYYLGRPISLAFIIFLILFLLKPLFSIIIKKFIIKKY